MKIWVSSQDEGLLIVVDRFKVVDNKVYSENELLGIYETKERAVEVLKEIKESLKLLQKISLMKVALFLMPKK